MSGWAVGRLGDGWLSWVMGGWAVWAVWAVGRWVVELGVGRLGGWVLGWAVRVLGVELVFVLGWLFVMGCWGVGLLCCENMERHRQAKAHDNEEGSGEMGTDFGASKTLWPSG